MFSDNQPRRRILTKGKFESKSLKEIKNFIERNIGIFQKEYNKTTKEKGLNQQFILCMNNEIRDEKFFFHHEYIEDISRGNSAQVDIAVIPRASQKALFVLEAKRLDSKITKKREKEYVVGRFDNDKYIESGGIERFKKEIHGNGLIYVGMIGYMQTDDFDTWFTKINSWIEEEVTSATSPELTWNSNDRLMIQNEATIYNTYLSTHKCLTKKINMYHIWVDLT